tara:strand:- start:12221 stop:13234 length:1014 start_codon:yes stop_codon:yes gene_type:complete
MFLSSYFSSLILLMPLIFSGLYSKETRHIFYISFFLYVTFLVFYTDLSGPDILTYENWAIKSCYTNFQTDPLISFFFSIGCNFFEAKLLVKSFIFFMILTQLYCLRKIFSNFTLALIVYFGFGNFFLSNFNVISFNAALTIFLLAITFRSVILRYLFFILSPLAHVVGLFLVLSLLGTKLKITFALFAALISGIFFNLFLVSIGIEERLLNYFGNDDSFPLRIFIIFFSSSILYYLYKTKIHEDFQSLNLLYWSFITSSFILSIAIFVSISSSILERLINPILFLQAYFWLELLSKKYVNEDFLKILIVLVLITNLSLTVNDSSNGWSLSPFNIILF